MRILLVLLLLPQFLLPLTAKVWKLWPTTTVNKPYQTASGVAFDFPQAPETANYFLSKFSRDVSSHVTATFRITTSQGAAFTFCGIECGNPGTRPPNVRFYLEQHGWNSGCNWNDPNTPCQYRRWWSNPASQDLEAGDFTLSELLAPDKWSSVFGRTGMENPAAFQSALNNLERVGFSFGGGSFFGHGVSVTDGTAIFELLNFEIQ